MESWAGNPTPTQPHVSYGEPLHGGDISAHTAGYAPQHQSQAFPIHAMPIQPQQVPQQHFPAPDAVAMATTQAPSAPLVYKRRIRWENIIPLVGVVAVIVVGAVYGGDLLKTGSTNAGSKAKASKGKNLQSSAVESTFDANNATPPPTNEPAVTAVNPAALIARAKQQFALKRYSKVLATLSQLAAIAPLNAEMTKLRADSVQEQSILAAIDRAKAYYMAGKHQEAMKVLQAAYAKYHDPRIAKGMGMLQSAMNGGHPDPNKAANTGSDSGPAVNVPPGGVGPNGGPPVTGTPPKTSNPGSPGAPPTTPAGTGGDVMGNMPGM